MAYLGGRLVLGSGRTCPHDLRFLDGFFSGTGESGGVPRAVCALSTGLVAGACSSVKDLGVITSMGFSVFEVGVATSKRDE